MKEKSQRVNSFSVLPFFWLNESAVQAQRRCEKGNTERIDFRLLSIEG